MDASNPQSTITNQNLEAENARLRARIRELESDPSARAETDRSTASQRSRTRRTRTLSPETEDRLRDIPSHALDELDRLARGVSYAMAENLRSTSDVITSVAEELFGPKSQRRSESTTRRSSSVDTRVEVDRGQDRVVESDTDPDVDRVSNMADDLVAGVAKGAHESLEMPRRVIERFFDAYENEPQSRTEERTVQSRTVDEKGRRTRVKVKEEKPTRSDDSPLV